MVVAVPVANVIARWCEGSVRAVLTVNWSVSLGVPPDLGGSLSTCHGTVHRYLIQ